jgi:hypothetical protein
MVWLRNGETGKSFEVQLSPPERSKFRFKRACRGLDRIMEHLGYEAYFLTLTLNAESLEAQNRDLHKLFCFMAQRFRRAGVHWFYAWVVELQKQRYQHFGQKALHWHVCIVARHGALPDCHYDKEARRGHRFVVYRDGDIVTVGDLFDRWGKGNVFCMRAYSSGVHGYMGKYMEKDYSSFRGYRPEWANLRRWGASQMGVFAFPEWAYQKHLEVWGSPYMMPLGEDFKPMHARVSGGQLQYVEKGFWHAVKGPDVVEWVAYRYKSPWKLCSELPDLSDVVGCASEVECDGSVECSEDLKISEREPEAEAGREIFKPEEPPPVGGQTAE